MQKQVAQGGSSMPLVLHIDPAIMNIIHWKKLLPAILSVDYSHSLKESSPNPSAVNALPKAQL